MYTLFARRMSQVTQSQPNRQGLTSACREQAMVSCLALLAWQQQGGRVFGAKGNGCGLQQHGKEVSTWWL
jgi:hypothetical protein